MNMDEKMYLCHEYIQSLTKGNYEGVGKKK